MSIAKPFTFVANTYAKSSEVNANFDTVYAQVNTNISAIAQNATDIDNLENNKANINGDYSQRFAVADPTTNTDAVNKRSLMSAIGNSVDYISGLTIAKDSGSPEDTIIVSSGSCYDSTHAIVLSLSDATSKQNDNQGANTTYYVYIIGNATATSIDILISSSSTNPTLPSGYTLYRQIGYYTTDGDSHILLIGYYGESSDSNKSIFSLASSLSPDYNNRETLTVDTLYTATEPGWVFFYQCSNNGSICHYEINGFDFIISNNQNSDSDSAGAGVWFMVSPGDTYKLKSAGSLSNAQRQLFFCPLKGGN